MAAKFKNNVRKTGEKAPDGRPIFEVRLIAAHPENPKKKIVDTKRFIAARSLADAKAQQEALTESEKAKKLNRVGLAKRTLAEVTAEWVAGIKRHGTKTTWSSYARRLIAELGHLPVAKVTTVQLQRYLAHASDVYARSTLKGIRAVMVGIFDHAIERGDGLATNPAVATKLPKLKKDPQALLARLKQAKPTKRGLTAVELAAFLRMLHMLYPNMYALVLTLVTTGGRFAEISALRRVDVDMATGAMVILQGQVHGRLGPPKKDKARPHAVPLTTLAALHKHVAEMDLLKWPGHEEYLFPAYPNRVRKFEPLWSIWTVGKAIKATMRAIGVETTTATHFARHTLNGLMRGEVEDSVLRLVVGHATETQSVAYGDARVLAFAAEVDRLLLGASGSRVGIDPDRGEKQ